MPSIIVVNYSTRNCCITQRNFMIFVKFFYKISIEVYITIRLMRFFLSCLKYLLIFFRLSSNRSLILQLLLRYFQKIINYLQTMPSMRFSPSRLKSLTPSNTSISLSSFLQPPFLMGICCGVAAPGYMNCCRVILTAKIF
jgi:hypothetical protein